MNWKDKFKGKSALITGASSGIGAEFARQLAQFGIGKLILTARSEDKLKKLAQEMKGLGVQAQVLVADLSTLDGAKGLWQELKVQNNLPDVLINNAGFGIHGPHASIPWEKEEKMLSVDVLSLSYLTKAFLSDRGTEKEGYILLISSVGGYQPTPLYAGYAAAKSYVLNFGEALNYELRKTAVNLSVLSPGITDTGFFGASGQVPTPYQKLFMMKATPVVRSGLKALAKGKPSRIAGIRNKIMTFFIRFMSRKMTTRVAHFLMK